MAKKTKQHRSVVITVVICITALEMYALSQGFNGIALTAVIALLAGIAGYVVPSHLKK